MTTAPARVTAADANRQFSKLLGRVSAGETVTITSRGKPVARLVPAADEAAAAAEEMRLAAVAALFKRLKSQPPVDIIPYDRDDLYDV